MRCGTERSAEPLKPRDPEVVIAERLARRSHAGQVDKSGRPYVHHLERVVSYVDGDQAKAVAWLHDTLEDTNLSIVELRAEGISEEVVRAVQILTRVRPDRYDRYIDAVIQSGNELAIEVKRADLCDHLSPTCPAHLRAKYELAWLAINKAHPLTV